MYIARIFLTVVYFILPVTIPAVIHAQNWGKVTPEEWSLTPPPDYPEANAVIVFDKGTMKVTNEVIKLSRHVRMKVFNKAGTDEIGSIDIPFSDDDRLSDLDAQTITPDGKKHQVNKKDIHTKTYGTSKARTFSFPVLDSGCVVEYRYTISNQTYYRLDPWYFQSDLFTLRSEFVLILGPGFTYSSATMNMPSGSQKPKEELIANPDQLGMAPLKSHTWVMENLPPIKEEPYMSFSKGYMAAIYNQLVSYRTSDFNQFFIRDWKDLGKRFQEVLDSYVDSEKKVAKLTDSITAGVAEPLAKAETIYNFLIKGVQVRDDPNGHYFTNDKLGGLLQTMTGTEDEINVLLWKMLKAAGIDSWPILIGTRSRNVFMPQVFQLDQFNHLITLMESDSTILFMDASSRYCPFGVLPPESRAAGGFLIDSENSHLVKLVTRNPKSFRHDATRMYLKKDGSAVCSTAVKFQGYFAVDYGERHDSKAETDFAKDYFLGKLNQVYEIDTVIFRHDTVDQFTMDLYYTLPEAGKRLEEFLSMKPLQYYFRENPFKSEKRSFPVDFNYPFVFENIVQIALEEGMGPQNLPDPVEIKITDASFTRNCMYDGNNIIILSRLAVDKPAFPPGSYRPLRELFQKVAAAVEDDLILTVASE